MDTGLRTSPDSAAEAIKGELRLKGNPAPSHHKRWVDTINHIVNPPRTPDTDKDAGRLVWSVQKSSTPDPGCNAVAQPQDRSCSCPAAAAAAAATTSTCRCKCLVLAASTLHRSASGRAEHRTLSRPLPHTVEQPQVHLLDHDCVRASWRLLLQRQAHLQMPGRRWRQGLALTPPECWRQRRARLSVTT